MAKDSESNLLAAVSYVLGPVIAILIYAIKEKDAYVRFHAAQALMMDIGFMMVWFAYFIFMTITGAVTLGIALIALVPIAILFAFGFMAYSFYVAYQAYQGKLYMVPTIGELAKKHSKTK